ncbi:MAG: TlpA family protein disulfide reductase, partial [Pyrinomonadaceae bacterium]
MFKTTANSSLYEVLMRETWKKLAAFGVFAMIVASWTGCTTGSAGSGGPAGNSSSVPGTSASSIYPKLAVALADADQETLDGGAMKISDYKGKVVLLNIWGTWCVPCRAEIPHLVKMKEKYG